MRHVAIIGAGELGGAVAHGLARSNLARAITLVDEHSRVAEGKALDIAQAAPVENFATTLSGSTDIAAAAGVDVVVIADRFSTGEWPAETALPLLRRVSQMASSAVVVCAGASYCPLVDGGARELKIARQRLIGSAPEAFAAAIRALIALAIDASPRDVAVSVLGVPPKGTIIAWEEASVAGFALRRLLSEPARRRIDAQVTALWPPGPLALAAAAVQVVSSIGRHSRRLTTCFVAPDRSAGERTRTAALPVRLGPGGIMEIVVPELSVAEKIALDNAILL
jgi:malate/lactate dehydrogenase